MRRTALITLTLLFVASSAPAQIYNDLMGVTKEEAKTAQLCLKLQDYDVGTIDGLVGPRILQAYTRWYLDHQGAHLTRQEATALFLTTCYAALEKHGLADAYLRFKSSERNK